MSMGAVPGHGHCKAAVLRKAHPLERNGGCHAVQQFRGLHVVHVHAAAVPPGSHQDIPAENEGVMRAVALQDFHGSVLQVPEYFDTAVLVNDRGIVPFPGPEQFRIRLPNPVDAHKGFCQLMLPRRRFRPGHG